ncbi:lysosomal alpha-glucosidase-like [Phyllobates terribilis]|uniref:lysosomal alpha-glucosidase-like n=1 Tax=Phyllobates terribilis TaxID=111132 RepID=UPI003CCB3350
MTTEETRKNCLNLVVALTPEGFARGDLFWDDGDSLGTFERMDYTQVLFIATNNALVSEVMHLNSEADDLQLASVQVFGIPNSPKKVLVNQVPTKDFAFRSDTKVLTISKLNLQIGSQFAITLS